MTDDLPAEIDRIALLFRDKLGLRGGEIGRVVRRARYRVPRRIRRKAEQLAAAAPILAHPRLRMTLDHAELTRAATDVGAYLDGVDPADRRKGWWLGALGALAFNLLLFGVLLVVFLRWKGLF